MNDLKITEPRLVYYYTYYQNSNTVIIPSPIYKDKGSLESLIKKDKDKKC